MASGVSGPDGNDSNQAPKIPQTGMTKMYSSKTAPGFAQMLNRWFPGQVTSEMVTAFEQGVMQMISNSINEAKTQHQIVQDKIKRRIDEG